MLCAVGFSNVVTLSSVRSSSFSTLAMAGTRCHAVRRETSLRFEDAEIGQQLAPCPIPLTPTRIVATAIASRDYQDVHHDPVLARKRGLPNIFMNILTSGGLSARYITDWAGPEARMRNLKIRLGAPNYPGDCMTMYGSVSSKQVEDGVGVVGVEFRGTNRLGNHAVGTTELELPVGTPLGAAHRRRCLGTL